MSSYDEHQAFNGSLNDTDSTPESVELKNLKAAFVRALHSDAFCGVCWCTADPDQNLNSLDDTLAVELNFGIIEMYSARQILHSVFNTDVFTSNNICLECLKSTAETFRFVLKAKELWKLYKRFADEIDTKINETMENIEEKDMSQINNVLIVLDNPIKSTIENAMPKDTKIVKEKIGNDDTQQTYKCDYCYTTFHLKKTLMWHLNYIHDIPNLKTEKHNKHNCPDCETTTCIHCKYLKTKRNEDGKMTCIDCEFVCKHNYELIAHVNEMHLNNIVASCDFCDKLLYSHHSYKKHILIYHAELYKCNFCDHSIFGNKDGFHQHFEKCKNEMFPLKCDICPGSFRTKFSLQRHKSSHEGMFKCEICGKKLTTRVSYEYHKKRHAVAVKRVSSEPTCEFCQTTFASFHEKKIHMKTHSSDEKPYCHECCVTFDSLQKYRRHIERKHKNAKYQCDFCDYACTVDFQLDAHINRYHLKATPYECKECGKSFTGRTTLLSHMRSHTKGHAFQCELCGNYLSTSAGYKKHMRRHTGDKPYKCDECEEGFVCATTLKFHKLKAHSDDRVSCPLCNGKFINNSLLRTHVKVTHWKNKDEEFDFKKVEGITPEHYHLFRDKRMIQIDGEEERTCEIKRRLVNSNMTMNRYVTLVNVNQHNYA